MELWDLYDGDRKPLDKAVYRGEDILEGQYHIVVAIWIVNSNKEILVTLRHMDKKEYPNMWENPGGAALSGESSSVAIIRELYEETGIRLDEEDLYLLSSSRDKTCFVDLYIAKKDVDISDMILQKGETADAKWVKLAELDRMMENKEIAEPIVKRLQRSREEFEDFLFNT